MKRMLALALCLVMVLGLFTGVVSAETLTNERPVQESDLIVNPSQAAVKSAFDLDGTTYYMGVGNGGAFEFPLSENQYETLHVSVQFFTSPNNGGSNGSAPEYQQVTSAATLQKIGDAVSTDGLTFTITPAKFIFDNGFGVTPPKYYPEIQTGDFVESWMQPRLMQMGRKQAGVWYLHASGTINGQPVEASHVIHW